MILDYTVAYIGSANLTGAVPNEINRQLESAGVLVKRGAIVDANITDSIRRRRGRKEYEVVEDLDEETGRSASEKAMLKGLVKPNVDGDARWVKKMHKLHFGYKRHTVTGENSLIIAVIGIFTLIEAYISIVFTKSLLSH